MSFTIEALLGIQPKLESENSLDTNSHNRVIFDEAIYEDSECGVGKPNFLAVFNDFITNPVLVVNPHVSFCPSLDDLHV